MGWRFQKRIRILPGLRINLSKSGVSTTVGTKGLSVNLRGDKVRTTIGLPGTGISYSESSKGGSNSVLAVAVLAAIVIAPFGCLCS
jgi:hypothetical protein